VGRCCVSHGVVGLPFAFVGMLLLKYGAGIRGSASMFRVLVGIRGIVGRWRGWLHVWRRVRVASCVRIFAGVVGRSFRIVAGPVSVISS